MMAFRGLHTAKLRTDWPLRRAARRRIIACRRYGRDVKSSTYSLTPEQIDSFYDRGYAHLPKFLTEAELEPIEAI